MNVWCVVSASRMKNPVVFLHFDKSKCKPENSDEFGHRFVVEDLDKVAKYLYHQRVTGGVSFALALWG